MARSLHADSAIALAVLANMPAKNLPSPASSRPSAAMTAAAENARDASCNQEFPPCLLEERAGLGHGPGGGATWLEVDSLCVISQRQVYVGTYARARDGGLGGGYSSERKGGEETRERGTFERN